MSAFLTVAIVHLLAVAAPGPDFILVVKHALTRSYKAGIYTAIGLGLGIIVHVAYSLVGIGILIAQSIILFNAIKYIGAGYLLYIGYKSLTSKKAEAVTVEQVKRRDMPAYKAVWMGFLCNALNPKATLFFLALFTQVVDQSTPLLVQVGYGIYMSFATAAWFSLVATVFSWSAIRSRLAAIQHILEKTMGAILIALGLKVALSTQE